MEQAKQPKIPLSPPLRKGVDAGHFFYLGFSMLVWFPLRWLLLCEYSQEQMATDNRIMTDGAGQTAENPP